LEFWDGVWAHKTRMTVLHILSKFDDTYNRFDTIADSETDRQTDRQTQIPYQYRV